MTINPFFATDGYKTGHHLMYPEGCTYVYSNETFRSNRHAPMGVDFAAAVGMQAALIKIHWMFEDGFFRQPRGVVLDRIQKKYSEYLGYEYNVDHIGRLWDHGHLPIRVKTLPEGTIVPIGTPFITIENTHPDFYWITNFLETMLSAMTWKMPVAATIAYLYKKILLDAAYDTDKDNVEFVDFQAHNFSMRGMDGLESAETVGLAHGMLFLGDDTLMTLEAAEKYYHHQGPVVHSVNATEHSVMCAGGNEDGAELDTFRWLMKQFPSGILSIVSDTWNLWTVLEQYLPELKDEIMARDGKIVIRPDSGDPIDIICGKNVKLAIENNDNRLLYVDRGLDYRLTEWKGVVETLWDTFGGTVNDQGFKVLDPHIGAIYGDSITLERASEIVKRLKMKGFASTNIVLGVGSYTYQYNTRDTFGIAMKATYVELEVPTIAKDTEGGLTPTGESMLIKRNIYKDPVTDDGRKKSLSGKLAVINKSHLCGLDELLYDGTDEIVTIDNAPDTIVATNLLIDIYVDGKFVFKTDYETIRERFDLQLRNNVW